MKRMYVPCYMTPCYGLHLMSDTYIINDVLRELQDKQ